MLKVGIVSNDTNGGWLGGRYYLQHLIKSVAYLPEEERLPLVDVWWQNAPETDPFAEVREYISCRAILRFPESITGRIGRKLRKFAQRDETTRDLFIAAGIGALFPLQLCELPGIPTAYWLADLQYKKWTDFLSSEKYAWFEKNHSENVSKAALVVLSSMDSLQDYQQTFPLQISKARVLNFTSVPDAHWWSVDPKQVAAHKGIPDKFFFVGNQFNQYKNHEVIFEATKILKDQGINIAVVCTGNTQGFTGNQYYTRLAEYISLNNLGSNIFILGMLPRAEQLALMRRSIAILQPSKCEGWSTLIEDGRTLGKPMLVSDIPVNKEQLGTLFTDYLSISDANCWAEKMRESWGHLLPGPDIEVETEALSLAKLRAVEVGRRFVSIMKETMA